mmetsp:Transcript_132154/g.196898  ORF Transcript_132154/g.196898 Transcript_132154/m.196898 type:complete len:776 (-) Transcript_132154:424-2751(-)|eukprot:CAMPEP_0117040492 /NCGR_PEP_ID=MMETSP0472-20121206/28333_1 /TAXON_ID=693140 ORGANISM="Tiarina fusus, Strain LIS" /NCGR_SAMPLE_ID=MMETSP0472 /ASSEMBLY_ACC=CAM_ASM_000603 /LENGTH=775 /DNA_ID=CAMNT_0004751237 /DNA_START=157 /DNA_END=2484 /DNA_ORIENTATION=-
MSSRGGGGDTIQISLGSTANAVTAHTLNLQGLAVTSSTSDYDDDGTSTHGLPVCNAQTTHHIQNNHWVPRVLMVDEPTRYFVPQISQQALLQQQQTQQQQHDLFSGWSGGGGIEAFVDPNLTLQHETPAWGDIHSSASLLAYSSHSRYYQEHTTTTASSSFSYNISSSNPRHVNWDDDNDNEEDDEQEQQEDPQDRRLRLQRERSDWNRNTYTPVQQQLESKIDDAWEQQQRCSTNNFMDIWMPPYSPKSLVALPYSRQSSLMSNNWWESYQAGVSVSSTSTSSILNEWNQDVLLENLRRLLEESDGCQGVTITTEGSGVYAGLTTALLQELQEECASAGRIVYHVVQDVSSGSSSSGATLSTNNGDPEKKNEQDWHSLHVDRLRRHLGSGLALHDFCENAHAVLPLRIPAYSSNGSSSNNNNISFLEATAQVALALEAATLPFRLHPRQDSRYQVGLLNAPFFGGQDTQWGSSGQRVSVPQFLQCLQPSSRYSVLELDVLASDRNANDSTSNSSPDYKTPTASTVWDEFKAGTSIERDQRMRESGRDGQRSRPRDEAPGGWLDDVQHGGILTSLSQKKTKTHDSSSSSSPRHRKGGNQKEVVSSRAVHHHFALSTSVRTVIDQKDDNNYKSDKNPNNNKNRMTDYSTCLIQGMGIRYRPERSMCTVLNQTVGQLTRGGGGAGAYWSKVIGTDAPTVAVVGNTTRSYPHLEGICADLKSVLGPRYRGYYQRDLVNGIVPELEDCEEAVAGCLDIRDAYRPPDGSGLVEDEGDDFM